MSDAKPAGSPLAAVPTGQASDERRTSDGDGKGSQNPTELTKLRFDYAWKWFNFHADQRVKLFNYMILAFGFFATATVAMANSGFADVAIGLCLGASMLALAFFQLDGRNWYLVGLAEDVLTELEQTYIFSAAPGTAVESTVHVRGKQVRFGILWRQFLEEGPRQHSFLCDIARGKHRVYFPLIALVICALFAGGAVWLIEHRSEILERRTQVDSEVAVSVV